MQAYRDGELVDVTTEEFVQSLYQHANWAEEEFKVRSDPASSLGMLMTQAANEIDRLQAEVRKSFWAGFWAWAGPANEREFAEIEKAEVAAWEEYKKLGDSTTETALK